MSPEASAVATDPIESAPSVAPPSVSPGERSIAPGTTARFPGVDDRGPGQRPPARGDRQGQHRLNLPGPAASREAERFSRTTPSSRRTAKRSSPTTRRTRCRSHRHRDPEGDLAVRPTTTARRWPGRAPHADDADPLVNGDVVVAISGTVGSSRSRRASGSSGVGVGLVCAPTTRRQPSTNRMATRRFRTVGFSLQRSSDLVSSGSVRRAESSSMSTSPFATPPTLNWPRTAPSSSSTTRRPAQSFASRRRAGVIWRYAPRAGRAALDHPSLAVPLADGTIALNDDDRARSSSSIRQRTGSSGNTG